MGPGKGKGSILGEWCIAERGEEWGRKDSLGERISLNRMGEANNGVILIVLRDTRAGGISR